MEIGHYNFDEVIDRTGTNCVKYDLAEKVFKEKDIIPLWVADMDFKTPDVVINELKKVVEHGIYAYSITPDTYYNAFINWCAKRHNWRIEKEYLLDVHGLLPALNIAIKTLTKRGEGIIIQPPVYHPFTSAIENNGRVVIKNRLIVREGKYSIDFDLLTKQAKEASMFILCSPHNPVARVWTREELAQLAEICLANNVIIISDDIHADIIFSGHKHIPIASLSEEISNHCVTLMAPGKTFNLQGLQSAFAVTANKEFKDKMQKEKETQGFMLNNLFSMVSCMAAFKKGEDWLNALNVYLEQNRDHALKYFQEHIPKIKPVFSEGTYIMWLDCAGMNKTHQELKDFFAHKAKVGLIDGKFFDEEAEFYFRINIATPKSILDKALVRIKDSV